MADAEDVNVVESADVIAPKDEVQTAGYMTLVDQPVPHATIPPQIEGSATSDTKTEPVASAGVMSDADRNDAGRNDPRFNQASAAGQNWADRAGIKAPATTSDDYADNRTKDGGMISEHVVQAGLKAMRDKFVEELGHEKMKGRREKVTFKADFGVDGHGLSAGSSDYGL